MFDVVNFSHPKRFVILVGHLFYISLVTLRFVDFSKKWLNIKNNKIHESSEPKLHIPILIVLFQLERNDQSTVEIWEFTEEHYPSSQHLFDSFQYTGVYQSTP